MLYILLFIFSLILSIIGFLILKQINTLDCKLKSLSLIYNTLLSQNIETTSRLFKFQEEIDPNFVIIVDVHPVLPVSLSIDDTGPMLIFLICGFCIWYGCTFWPLSVKSVSFFGCVKSSFSAFLIQKNVISLKFRDIYWNMYSVNLNESNQTYEVFIRLDQEKFYLLQDYYRLYPKGFVPKFIHLYEITCRTGEATLEVTRPEMITELVNGILLIFKIF